MKKFENIVIASDLDGTYFGNKVRLVPRNLEAIKYFCDNGGHFTFNTGRLPIFMRKSLPNITELINMPAITGNGTCLYDFEKDQAIEEHFVEFEAFMELVDFVRAYSEIAGFRGVIEKGFVIHSLDNKYNKKEYEHLPDFMEKKIMPIPDWECLNMYKVNMMDTEERLERLFPVLKERFDGKLTINRAGLTWIEIMPRNTGKGIMLRSAVERLFKDKMTVCTVGDFDNDLDMHSVADLPVCPANANERVKAACKHTLCSNDDGVIADLIDLLDN